MTAGGYWRHWASMPAIVGSPRVRVELLGPTTPDTEGFRDDDLGHVWLGDQ